MARVIEAQLGPKWATSEYGDTVAKAIAKAKGKTP